MCVSGLFLSYSEHQRELASKRVPDIPLPLTSRPPLGACRTCLTGRHCATGDVPHEGSHFPRDGGGDDGRLLAALAEFTIPRRQMGLCFPGNVLNLGGLFLKDIEQPSQRSPMATHNAASTTCSRGTSSRSSKLKIQLLMVCSESNF